MFRFATEAIPPKDRVAVWCEVIGRQHMQLDIALDDPDALRADLEIHGVASSPIALLRTTPARYTRTRLHAQSSNGDFVFVGTERGFRFVGDNQDLAFGEADSALLFTGCAGTIAVPHADRATTVRVSGTALRAAVRDLAEQPALPFWADNAPLRLARNYIGAIVRSGEIDDPLLDHIVSAHLVDLIALGLQPTEDTRERARAGAVRAVRVRAALDAITAHAHDPALDPARVAGQLGVSVRYLHRLLEETGASFSEHLLARRIDRACRLLRDPRLAQHKISDLALQAGFLDLSHFNRSFRRRVGATPSDVRAAALRPRE